MAQWPIQFYWIKGIAVCQRVVASNPLLSDFHVDNGGARGPRAAGVPLRGGQSQPGSTSSAQAMSGPMATTNALYFKICL
jgi:hypothetical protein